MQFQKARTTSCCSLFRRTREIAWNHNGDENFQNCRLLELAVSTANRKWQTASYVVVTFISSSAAETERVGKQLANDLRAGCVLALKGELGSGKTTFTKGLVSGLGSSTAATSPT